MLKLGTTAPDFSGPASNGTLLCLSEYAGNRPLVLYFYNKNFSVGCTKEAKLFRDNARQLNALGCNVLGVSKDTVESHQAFVKSLVLGYPLVSDPDQSIIRSYKVFSMFGVVDRVTFVLDANRVVRMAHRSLFDYAGHLEATVQCARGLVGTTPVPTPSPASTHS
jgi:peroxiredoxin Q/BCP